MYAPKSQEFDLHVMNARVQLAVIDFNENASRDQAVVTKKKAGGAEVGELMWKFQISKHAKDWTSKPVKKPKSNEFVKTLLLEVIEKKESGEKIDQKADKIEGKLKSPKNIAPLPRPDTSSILKKRQKYSRFKK